MHRTQALFSDHSLDELLTFGSCGLLGGWEVVDASADSLWQSGHTVIFDFDQMEHWAKSTFLDGLLFIFVVDASMKNHEKIE